LVQKAHDELSKLGGICTDGSAADGNAIAVEAALVG
jgi:hypothetical protein